MFPAYITSVRHKDSFMTSENSCLLLKENEISNCVEYNQLIGLPAIHKSLADTGFEIASRYRVTDNKLKRCYNLDNDIMSKFPNGPVTVKAIKIFGNCD